MLIIGFFTVVYLVPSTPQTTWAREIFSDLGNSKWAEDGIYDLTQRGTIAGYGNGIFKPSSSITRAQAVTYLIREIYPDRNFKVSEVKFRDLPKTHMFYSEMAKAVELGLVAGFDDGTVRPDAPISRGETATILARLYVLEPGGKTSELSDIRTHWAKEPILLLASNGLIGGYPDGSFGPDRSVSRAEFAVFLSRVISFEREQAIEAKDWNKLLGYMTLEEKVGQMLMPDIRMWNGKPSYSVNGGVEELLYEQQPGGLILFDKNITDAKQLITFNHQLQQAAGDIPLFLGIDQEGGVVNRIPGGTNLPGNMALGATGQPALSKQAGIVTGTELKALGVNLDFAPVLDVNVNPDNPIIGIRSFGADPDLVADFGVQFMKGLEQSGVISAVKHFPGHGDTTVDSHLGLPVVTHDKQRLEAIELKPFRAAVQNGAGMVMSSHIAFPALDDTKMKSKKDGSSVLLPATLSSKIMTGLLREELGFDGVIVTDAFTMNGIAEHFGEEEAVRLAVKAGVDIILMPQDIPGAHQAIVQAVKNGEIDKARIDASVTRILELKQEYGLFETQEGLQAKLQRADKIIGSKEHREVEQGIAEQAITELVNNRDSLPLRLSDGDTVAVLAPTVELSNSIEDSLSSANFGKRFSVESLIIGDKNASETYAAINRADHVILVSYQFRSSISDYDWAAYQDLIDKLNTGNKSYVLLSAGNPYEMMFLQDVKSGIASYGAEAPNLQAAVKVIFGVNKAKGKLPEDWG
ncbi:glycoside hydrolase family 3 N-terminal domain-containing protein [Paenibacillus sp. M1]|uniref:beta-N-acetylhexosaminidase n=1 Tax=Paenibacillus haidiansis TaxID=1574488 RepID=A0ABU7VPU1_9BACL